MGGILAAVLVTASLSSQIGRLWTFGDLLTASDIVVIGKAVDVRDTGRRSTHRELRPGVPVIEMEADIHVLAVLKRPQMQEADVGRLVLHHYRLNLGEWRRQHPAASGQPPSGLLNAGEYLTLNSTEETYLFFLTRAGAGGWEPTTGHTFPNQSVFALGGAARLGR